MATTMSQLPFDLQSRQEDIVRQRRYAEMLRQQAMSPIQGQMIGRHYVPASPLENLSRLGMAYMSRNAEDDASTGMRELTSQYNKKLGEGLEGYFATRDGQPARPGETLPTEDGLDYQMPGQPAVRGDPRRAAATALTSGLPALARLGQSDLEAMAKNQLTPKDLLSIPGASVASRVAAAQGNDPTRLAADPRQQVVNNRIVEQGEGGRWNETYDGTSKFHPPVMIAGDMYQQDKATGKFYKLDNAAKVTVGGSTVTLDKAKLAGMSEWAQLAGKTVKELTDGARASARMISSLRNIENAGSAGMLQGPLANFGIFMGQLATAAGFRVDAAKLANSETASSEIIRLWADMMQANGGARGLVKEESEKMFQSLPTLSQSPEGRMQIIKILRAKAEQDIEVAKQAAAEYSDAIASDNPRAFTFGLTGTMLPEPAMNPRPGVPGVPSKSVGPGGLPPGWTITPVTPAR